MAHDADALIPDIRAASRELVRVWGLLDRTVAGTDLSASAVHALIEIGRSDGITARAIAARLRLEKSSVSRLIGKLIARGEVCEGRAGRDGRVKPLHLTAQGRRTLATIDAVAGTQVADALDHLDAGARRTVLTGLSTYARALGAVSERPAAAAVAAAVRFGKGYVPGLIGRAVEMMAVRILRDYPMGMAFETRVAREMAEFLPRADAPQNGIWHAQSGGRIVGTITIDGDPLGAGRAHLRWFVVAEDMQGAGLGAALLDRALAHCDARGFREVHLWTVRGLDAARRLYERAGFALAEEFEGDQWGARVVEQRFVRRVSARAAASDGAAVSPS